MTSSERATARLAAALSSTAGRFVLTWRPGSAPELASCWRSAAARVAVAVSWPAGIRDGVRLGDPAGRVDAERAAERGRADGQRPERGEPAGGAGPAGADRVQRPVAGRGRRAGPRPEDPGDHEPGRPAGHLVPGLQLGAGGQVREQRRGLRQRRLDRLARPGWGGPVPGHQHGVRLDPAERGRLGEQHVALAGQPGQGRPGRGQPERIRPHRLVQGDRDAGQPGPDGGPQPSLVAADLAAGHRAGDIQRGARRGGQLTVRGLGQCRTGERGQRGGQRRR